MLNRNKFLGIFLSVIFCFGLVSQAYAADVVYEYTKQIGGSGSEVGRSIALDSSGNIYTSGTFAGTVDFDPGAGVTELTSAGSGDLYIQKLDSDGNLLWVKQFGSAGDETRNGMMIDSSDNIYLTGHFFNTVDFDPGAGTTNLVSAGSDDAFVLKLNASGAFVWVKQIGGAGSDFGTSIAKDSSGNVYSTCIFTVTVDFDPGAGTSNLTSGNLYTQKLDSNGDFLWAKSISYTSYYLNPRIKVDNFDNVYSHGYFTGTTDFDPGAGTTSLSATSCDAFVQKLDSSGAFVWVKRFGGADCQTGDALGFDSSNNLYLSGGFGGSVTVDFDLGAGTSNLTPGATNDIYILKLDTNGDFVWVKQIGSGWGLFQGISFDSADNVYLGGDFWFTYDFDPGAGVSNGTSLGGQDALILKLNASGEFVWAKYFGGTGGDSVNALTVDSSGNVYATGNFQSTVDFDPGTGVVNLTSAGSFDAFVMKLIPDVVAPTITNISSSKANGSYTVGEVIDIDVTFSEAVTSTGVVTVTLETGTVDRTCTFTVTASDTGTCNYTVATGDTSFDLTVASVSGTIADSSSNAMVSFVPAVNLAANKAIVVDGAAPVFSVIAATSLTFTGATITWTTDEASSSIVEYGQTTGYGFSTTEADITPGVTGHSVSLSNLAVCTTYHYSVKSKDAFLILGTSDDKSFTTECYAAVPVAVVSGGGSVYTPTSPVVPQTSTPVVPQSNTPVLCDAGQLFNVNTGQKCTEQVAPQAGNSSSSFSVNMGYPVRSNDVLKLQQFLNTHGYLIAVSGAGSPGNETNYFGPATRAAVIKFQKANNITPSIGYFGPRTRIVANAIIK